LVLLGVAGCDDDGDQTAATPTGIADTGTAAAPTVIPTPLASATDSAPSTEAPTAAATPGTSSEPTPPPAVLTTVAATLTDYAITLDRSSAPAGSVRFIATNVSSAEAHELVVSKIQPDGSFAERGVIEAIDPQEGGAITLELEPGAYELACRIRPGESGSSVDHYLEGQRIAFTVE
jgi:hypothetical protein